MPITQRFEVPDDFPIASFKAQYQGETMSDFKKYDPMADLAVMIAQIWMMRKSSKQKAQFGEDFFTSTFVWANFQYFWTPSVLHGWKGLTVRNFLVPW